MYVSTETEGETQPVVSSFRPTAHCRRTRAVKPLNVYIRISTVSAATLHHRYSNGNEKKYSRFFFFRVKTRRVFRGKTCVCTRTRKVGKRNRATPPLLFGARNTENVYEYKTVSPWCNRRPPTVVLKTL